MQSIITIHWISHSHLCEMPFPFLLVAVMSFISFFFTLFLLLLYSSPLPLVDSYGVVRNSMQCREHNYSLYHTISKSPASSIIVLTSIHRLSSTAKSAYYRPMWSGKWIHHYQLWEKGWTRSQIRLHYVQHVLCNLIETQLSQSFGILLNHP